MSLAMSATVATLPSVPIWMSARHANAPSLSVPALPLTLRRSPALTSAFTCLSAMSMLTLFPPYMIEAPPLSGPPRRPTLVPLGVVKVASPPSAEPSTCNLLLPPISPVTLPAIETTSFAPSPPNSTSVGIRPSASMITSASDRAPALSVKERCSRRRTPLVLASSRRIASTAGAFIWSRTLPVFPSAVQVRSSAVFTSSGTDWKKPAERPLVISAAAAAHRRQRRAISTDKSIVEIRPGRGEGGRLTRHLPVPLRCRRVSKTIIRRGSDSGGSHGARGPDSRRGLDGEDPEHRRRPGARRHHARDLPVLLVVLHPPRAEGLRAVEGHERARHESRHLCAGDHARRPDHRAGDRLVRPRVQAGPSGAEADGNRSDQRLDRAGPLPGLLAGLLRLHAERAQQRLEGGRDDGARDAGGPGGLVRPGDDAAPRPL